MGWDGGKKNHFCEIQVGAEQKKKKKLKIQYFQVRRASISHVTEPFFVIKRMLSFFL